MVFDVAIASRGQEMSSDWVQNSCIQVARHFTGALDESADPTTGRDEERSGIQGSMLGLQ